VIRPLVISDWGSKAWWEFYSFSLSDQSLITYNIPMPTPFYHLSIAEELLASPDLPESLHEFLQEERNAFLLGKTAPDVQTISGQSRIETHFYRIPLVTLANPWDKMFARYPHLGKPAGLSASQAAFISGYICHLQADVIWITDLFAPYFLPLLTRQGRKQVGYLHNVLRSYLDERILTDLPADVGPSLMDVNPAGWLPFVSDIYMADWRDYLGQQLMPGSKARTVEVFAGRLDVPVESFFELLGSEGRMEAEIFSFIPRQVLVEYRDKLVSANIQLLAGFLADLPHRGD
jgi:hypothetical protein